MRLGSISVWFPVLHLRAEVTYRLLPELTPLHRVLEAAVKQFSTSSNALAGVPIPDLFSQLFGVSGAEEMLPDVLDDLVQRGRIHRVVGDGRDPCLLRIADLAPGRAGGDMPQVHNFSSIENVAAQTRMLERFFDPVVDEIVDGDSLASRPADDLQFCVPAEPFLAHAPSHWVERELRGELHDDVQLYSVVTEHTGHLWRRGKAEIVLKDDEISIECSHQRESEYLRGLPQRVRASWLLPRGSAESLHGQVLKESELSIHCRLPPSSTGLALTRGIPPAARAGLALPPNVVVVALDPEPDITEPTVIPELAHGQAKQVAYPRTDNPGTAGIFLASVGRDYLQLPVTWEGLPAEIGVFRNAPGFQQDGSIWGDVIDALETECQYSDDPAIFVLPAFWLDSAEFWQRLSERLRSESDGPEWMDGIVDELKNLPQAVLARLSEKLQMNEPMAKLRSTYSTLSTLFPSERPESTKIQCVDDGITLVPRSCKRVIAFDSSSLLRYGQLVEHLRPTDFLVSPQVVAAEVEKNKTKCEEYRIASRRNLRAIDALPKTRWTAPFHDFDLLIPGDIQNSDGAIIATLVPYCNRGLEVIVVSEDHDFVLRCKPYGIEWMNGENFLDTCRSLRKGIKE